MPTSPTARRSSWTPVTCSPTSRSTSPRSRSGRGCGGDWNAIGLTGAAHTLAAYRRLPWGWRPAPTDVWTDLHMWQQFLDLPDFRGVTGTRAHAPALPEPYLERASARGARVGARRVVGRDPGSRGPSAPGAASAAHVASRQPPPSSSGPTSSSRRVATSSTRRSPTLPTRASARRPGVVAHLAAAQPPACSQAGASARRTAARSSLSDPSASSRGDRSGCSHGQSIPSPGSSQRQPSSSAGSHS